jgi:hypothetical protein
MNAKIVLSPTEVLEIIRKYVATNTDCDVKEAVALVSYELNELPTFDGISVSIKLNDKKK